MYGILCLWAFDALSIPAMATECERTFSSAKKLITLERNALSDAAIEANERLKAWWDQGLITRDERAMMRDLGIRCMLSIVKFYFFSPQRLSFLIWKVLIPGLPGPGCTACREH